MESIRPWVDDVVLVDTGSKNETKTRRCRVTEESVNCLGYTIGLCHSPRMGRSYICTKTSAKKIDNLKEGRDPRVDQSEMVVDDGRGPGGETEPEAFGMVKLLLSWVSQPGLSSH